MQSPADNPKTRPIVVAFPGQEGIRKMQNYDYDLPVKLFTALSERLGRRLSLVAVSHTSNDYQHLLKTYKNLAAVLATTKLYANYFNSGVSAASFKAANQDAAIVVATTECLYAPNHVRALSDFLDLGVEFRTEKKMVVALKMESVSSTLESIIACARAQGCEIPELATA